MKTEEITIRVDTESANAYRSASEEERRKLDLLLSLKLSEVTKSSRPLKEMINEISRNAQKRGLTPEILESLLHEQ